MKRVRIRVAEVTLPVSFCLVADSLCPQDTGSLSEIDYLADGPGAITWSSRRPVDRTRNNVNILVYQPFYSIAILNLGGEVS